MKRVSVLLALGVFMFSAVPAYAQIGTTDPLTVTIDPTYPRPYQTVTVTPGSTLIDLSASTVTISVNGTVISKGSGTTPAQFQAGGPGVLSTITVTAVNNGQTYQKKLSLRPADVSLIVEPVSTSHAFYRGAPLVASEGRVRLIAIPDLRTASGAAIPASSLVYTWKNGDQLMAASSGIGKSVLDATAPVRFRDSTITVTVATTDNSVVAQASTLISPVEPITRIYQSDPLLGPLFNLALPKSVIMTDAEQSFRGVAYYLSGTPSLAWTVNGAPGETGPDMTVRSNGSGSGTAVVNFSANQAATSQSANSSMTVRFGDGKSLGIFGL